MALELNTIINDILAQDCGRAFCGLNEVHKSADGRALAGAVGADEAIDLAGLDLEIEVLQGEEICASVALAEFLTVDDGVHTDSIVQDTPLDFAGVSGYHKRINKLKDKHANT